MALRQEVFPVLSQADFPELHRIVEEGIVKYRLGHLRDAITAAAAPCLLLHQRDDEPEDEDEPTSAETGSTRIGGLPDLPRSAPWPERGGKLLPFLAQLDLGAFPRFAGSPLPGGGWLFLFGVAEDDSAVGVFHRGGRDDLEWRRVGAHRIQPDWSGESIYDPVPIAAARLAVSLTMDGVCEAMGFDRGDDEGDLPDLPYEEQLRLAHLTSTLNPSNCYDERLGDVAGQVLGSMNFPGAAPGEGWVNLLEIQSVGSMMWSDCGMLNLLIRRSDLERLDFSRLRAEINSG